MTRVSRRLDNVYPNVSIDFKPTAIVLAVLEPLNQIQVPEQGTTNVRLLCVRACDVRVLRVGRVRTPVSGLANGIAVVRAADILNLDPFPLPEPELEVLEL